MTVCMFPGQGSQSKGVGKAGFAAYPELTEMASDILGYSIRGLCLEDPRKELRNTRFTQPALYVVNALAWRQWRAEHDEAPDFLIGHSLGEYNALKAADAMSFEDGLRLVQRRGALMAEAPPGAMAAVLGLSEDEVRDRLAGNGLQAINIADLNAPTQIVLSGLTDDIRNAAPAFEGDGVRYLPLNTSSAFHSRYRGEARSAFESFLATFDFATPTIPVVSNVHTAPYAGDDVAANLAAQITHSVRWTDSLLYLRRQGESVFEELGPGQVLTRLAGEIAAMDLPPVEAPSTDGVSVPASLGIDDWNRRYPPGTAVAIDGYDGALVTRTEAMMLFGHRRAVYLEGYEGYFKLSEVRPA